MADISRIARLIDGAIRNLDISSNALVVGSLKIGAEELTEAILAKLILVNNQADADGTYDSRYYTQTEIGADTASSGSDLVGDDDSYSNFTPTAATVKGALEGIDDALNSAGSDENVKVSANDTTSGYLEDKIVVSSGSNSTEILELSTLNDGGDEDLQIQIDESKIDHGALAGLSDDDHTQYILVDGTRAFSGNQSIGGNKLTSVADPTAAQDAATKAYVDSVAEGLRPKEAVRVATTVAGTLATSFENGDVVDGVTLATGDRILIKDQSAAEDNGIYVVAASGAPSRASDFDSLSPIDEINGAIVGVQEGTDNAGKVFVQQGNVATIGTDAINFVFFNSNSNLVGGDGITISGSNVSVDSDGEGLAFNGSSQLILELDGSTLSKAAAGVKVADLGVDTAQIADNAVTNDKMADDSVDTAEIVDLAVTNAKIADATIEDGKVASGSSLEEAVTFFDSSDISAAEAETLSDGSNADSLHSHSLLLKTSVAGEALLANETKIMRWAINGETAGRLYKAANDAVTTSKKYFGIALVSPSAGVTASDSIEVQIAGSHTLGSSTTSFAAADIGKEVFLTTDGDFSTTVPSANDSAVYRIGFVEAVDKIFIAPQEKYLNEV